MDTGMSDYVTNDTADYLKNKFDDEIRTIKHKWIKCFIPPPATITLISLCFIVSYLLKGHSAHEK